jgi:myosin heavy subunit
MDLVNQDDVTESGILVELQRRYVGNVIYSNIGSIIIACNPYQYLPELYSDGGSTE